MRASLIGNLNRGLYLESTLKKMTKSPYELDAFNSLFTAANEGRMSDYTVSDFAGCGTKSNRITMSTLHSSKGLQFDVVIIAGLEQGRLPWNSLTPEKLRESRRTFYVGITRARFKVFLLYSGHYFFRERRQALGPSKFLVELRENLDD